MLREVALGTLDLTAATQAARAANRININPKTARCIQYWCAIGEGSTQTGRGEYNFCSFYAQSLPLPVLQALIGVFRQGGGDAYAHHVPALHLRPLNRDTA